MTRPLCLASCFLPLNEENSRWWKHIQAALAQRGMELVLISSAPAADRELRTIVVPLWLQGFAQAYGTPPAPSTLEEPLARALAERDRAWIQQEDRDLSEFIAGLGTCQQVLRGILEELQPAVVLVWGSSLPQCVLLHQLAGQRGFPCWILERGLLPGTLMLEIQGHGGISELNWSFALQRALQRETGTELFVAAREHFQRARVSKYAQGAYLDPTTLRRRINPQGRRVVTALLQHDAASGLMPSDYGGARLHAPGIASSAEAVRSLAATARAQDALLLVKPHPMDATDYSRFEGEHVRIVREVHLHSLIEVADVVAVMTSTSQYEALLFDKPIVLMARSALAGKGIAYEAFTPEALPGALRAAWERREFAPRQAAGRRLLSFVLQTFSIALDDTLPFGASLRDLACFLVSNARPAAQGRSSEAALHALGLRLRAWESAPRPASRAVKTSVLSLPGPHALTMQAVANRPAFERIYQTDLAGRIQAQQRLNPGTGTSFMLPGFCVVCGCERQLTTDYLFSRVDAEGRPQPAWRERQICLCWLNARQRSCFHVLADGLGLRENTLIYCTEQTTDLFRHIQRRFPLAVGSEFLGDQTPLGSCDDRGIRNEDLTRLTFPDDAFDCIFSLDVLEHVPDYRSGLAELARCLKPGGRLLVTAPFHFGQDTTVVRAGWDATGQLIHHLPPVYHGDPLHAEGCLCFNDFGWDLLDEVRSAGFEDVVLHVFTAEEYGYLGLQYVLLARRQEVLCRRSTHRARPSSAPSGATGRSPDDRQTDCLLEPIDRLRQQADAARERAEWTAAGQLYRVLTRRLPDDLEVWRHRIGCARAQGHRVLSDLLLEEALERHPEWQDALVQSEPELHHAC